MVGGTDEVPPDAEQVLDDSVSGEEALRPTGRLEAAHLWLSLPGELVGDRGSIVGVLPRVVHNRRHGGPTSSAVASEFVGDEASWFAALALQ